MVSVLDTKKKRNRGTIDFDKIIMKIYFHCVAMYFYLEQPENSMAGICFEYPYYVFFREYEKS